MPGKPPPLTDFPCSTAANPIKDPQLFHSGSVILMDKPLNWSSFDVVKYVRSRIPTRKVGHAGTLDPLADGLLILCSGKATKAISQIQEMEKEYRALIRFGSSTPSFDRGTEPDHHAGFDHVSEEKIRKLVDEEFTGEIDQVPPIYSALKSNGKRLYEIARKGESVEIQPRKVMILEINIEHIELPDLTLTIRCGKGTYIRSLAHDLGIRLGSRAHLAALRRTKTGSFSVLNAVTPEQFDQQMRFIKNG